jgi:ABC-2 type transport system permease protein
MIGVIVRRELTDWLRDGRLRWLGAGCVALLLVVALVGWQSTLTQVEDRRAAVERETGNFLGQGAKNPHSAAHFGQYAFRPVLLPAAIDPGVSPWMGSMVWMEAHRRNLAEFRPAEDGAGQRQSTGLSVAWVLQNVVPLLVIMLGFATVAGERERGTLALLLAQGLRLRTLALGKGVAVFAATALLLLPVLLVILGLYLFTPTAVEAEGAAARLGWMGLAHALYLASFVGIAACVSLLARDARTALFTLLLAWVALVVLVPRLATDVAGVRHPVPAASEFWDAIKRGEGGVEQPGVRPEERAARLRETVAAELLARYGVARLEDLPVNFTAVYLQRLEDADAPVIDHVYGKLWSAQEQQRAVRSLAGLFSPTVPLRELSMALAGTDPYALRHFGDAAEAHRRQLVAELNGTQARDGAGTPFYVAPADTWQRMPQFHYEPPAASEVLARHRVDLALLALWALLPLLAAGLLAARRRDAR